MPSIDINGTRITYSDAGTGDPVVLIHCSSASGTEWSSLCELLTGDFRRVVPDQWSCGASDPWHGRTTFTLAEEAAPILAIIDRIGMPVHLVGHSYGGGVALRVARERPDMIRSLSLVEPSAFHVLRRGGARERRLFREIARVAETVARAVTSGDYWGGMGRFVDYWNGEGAWNAMAHDARIKLSQRLGKVALDFQALFEEPADLADYAALTPPTLIVCGQRSPGPSRRIVEMLADTMPQARVERIAGAGHMSPLTHRDQVNAAIGNHLQRTAAPRRRAA
ncbi:MAG: alpha/beta hydrolase [Gammaproteobacteria bacterium]|nr:alpha/beta hydrolase [Gammaproteobacteria bacterium]NIR90365.1 alpha/beta hydrolase [Gammaproteobacteria bacterium]NIU03317.1 alpha/beta hydrolase [Gammaproteobacteria bacterium]NIV50812.1 alpha/beta fold hydrolase [Gammaproteobacteria bacterium]NIW85724.1 alpha/beta fold hydrolase [Gammaproteobacteria bacterium]